MTGFGKLLPKVVIDTNVFVSGATISTSYPTQVVSLWRTEQLMLVTSEPLLHELRGVLSRPKLKPLGWTPEKASKLVQELRKLSVCVAGTTPVTVCRDPDDNLLFACAIEGEAKYIISGDEDVLAVENYQGIQTVTPREFVEQHDYVLKVA